MRENDSHLDTFYISPQSFDAGLSHDDGLMGSREDGNPASSNSTHRNDYHTVLEQRGSSCYRYCNFDDWFNLLQAIGKWKRYRNRNSPNRQPRRCQRRELFTVFFFFFGLSFPKILFIKRRYNKIVSYFSELTLTIPQVSQKSGMWDDTGNSSSGAAEGPSRSVSHAASLDAISRRMVRPESGRAPCRSLTCSVCK